MALKVRRICLSWSLRANTPLRWFCSTSTATTTATGTVTKQLGITTTDNSATKPIERTFKCDAHRAPAKHVLTHIGEQTKIKLSVSEKNQDHVILSHGSSDTDWSFSQDSIEKSIEKAWIMLQQATSYHTRMFVPHWMCQIFDMYGHLFLQHESAFCIVLPSNTVELFGTLDGIFGLQRQIWHAIQVLCEFFLFFCVN